MILIASPERYKMHVIYLEPIFMYYLFTILDIRSRTTGLPMRKVISMYKKGNKASCLSYRPISLTSMLCKFLKPIIYSNISSFLEGYFPTASLSWSITRISSLNFWPAALSWIHAFIRNGHQYCYIKNSASKYFRVTSGVPQGCVRASIIIYSNNPHHVINKANSTLSFLQSSSKPAPSCFRLIVYRSQLRPEIEYA